MVRRLHAAYGNHVSVVNEGIGGDTAGIPQVLPLRQVLPQRFSRDILGVSGITDVVFYAGTNDFGDGVLPNESIASLTTMVGILHTHGIKAAQRLFPISARPGQPRRPTMPTTR
jgi:hypothetical protein